MIHLYKYLQYEEENSEIYMWIGHSSGGKKELCSEMVISHLSVFIPSPDSLKGKAVLIKTIFLGGCAFVLFNIVC